MTRFILTICLLLFAALPLCAQEKANDVITLKNGVQIVGHIYKIDEENVYYRIGDEDFEYQISKQKVKEIRYANGNAKTFQKETSSAVRQAYQQKTFYNIEKVNENFFINHTYCKRSFHRTVREPVDRPRDTRPRMGCRLALDILNLSNDKKNAPKMCR